MQYKRLGNIAGWVVFAVTAIVYYLAAERTGSLWDCGEFISGAYKLQVVHPPGAPLFVLIGRIFTLFPEYLSDNPENIAFAINFLSGICSAFAAAFMCWITVMLGKLTLADRETDVPNYQSIALAAAGIVAGLGTAFCTSVWFSAVEGEVYAMSTFFTAMTLWAVIKWYVLPEGTKGEDQWLIFALFSGGMSIGVHLLSILILPVLTIFYYFKKYKKHTFVGTAIAAGVGLFLIFFIQKFIIAGIPTLWSWYELLMVNGFGLPKHSGIYPTIVTLGVILYFALRYAHRTENGMLQRLIVGAGLIAVGFSTLGVVVIRANANTPINMNEPSDAVRLIPYLNREQYGERPLMYGPHFLAKPVDYKFEDRYGFVEESNSYEIVDRKVTPVYDAGDKMLFPRMGDPSLGRPKLYKNEWMGGDSGPPTMAHNIGYFVRYQLGWMYWRYFMWNFSGRQNGNQGYTPANVSDGNWISGIPFIDNARLFDQSNMPETMANNKARNTYFMLPFIFGFIGLLYHMRSRTEDFLGLFAAFLITGIGIIVYSNQPPHEPRERDYVLAGSFAIYCIWIGMAVLAIMKMLVERAKLNGIGATTFAALIVLSAPLLMGTQNFDDHSRAEHKASRDYASNFLNSVEDNAIIFTYGDNDTYPLWYAQEVEGIRRDVRVVNLSLIAVDWYIKQLGRKVNDSPKINLTVTDQSYRGYHRNQLYIDPFRERGKKVMNLKNALEFVNKDMSAKMQGQAKSYFPARRLSIPVDTAKVKTNGLIDPRYAGNLAKEIVFEIKPEREKLQSIFKGDLAVMDIIASNVWDRPVYFSVTCRPESLLGLNDYLRLEGLGLRVVPYKTERNENNMFGMIGNGSIALDRTHDIVVNKWKWGNFDKKDLFVDRSYGPSIQCMQLSMNRAVQNLINAKDPEKAKDIIDTYFEAFPHMNFPYSYNTLSMIRAYVGVEDFESAKTQLRILAGEMADQLDFYYSINPKHIQEGGTFYRDFGLAETTRREIMRTVDSLNDPEFKTEMDTVFEGFVTEEIPN